MSPLESLLAVGAVLALIVGLLLAAPWLSDRLAGRPRDVGDTWPSRAGAPVNRPVAPEVNWPALNEAMRRAGRGAR